jgi:hypothetical protein
MTTFIPFAPVLPVAVPDASSAVADAALDAILSSGRDAAAVARRSRRLIFLFAFIF